MPSLTVIIPTHNPRHAVLGRVLAHLYRQSLSQEEWHAVLVDNASDPPVDAASVAAILPNLKVIRESRPGLLYARIAGIRTANGDCVVFVDDDNLLDPEYLRNARRFLDEHPDVGVLGGRILPEFESPPPTWARSHVGQLALRDLGNLPLKSTHGGRIDVYDYFAPFGAGMVIRTRFCREFVQSFDTGEVQSVDRCGQQLGGCGDCELVMRVWLSGGECAYSPDLALTHVIPSSRLTFRYLQRLAREGQESWAEFLCRHGLAVRIPRWTVPLRQLKAIARHRAWTRSGFVAWRGACGFFAGAATRSSSPANASLS